MREGRWKPDMEFVQNFTPLDFQAKNFTPSISPNVNSFSKKKYKLDLVNYAVSEREDRI